MDTNGQTVAYVIGLLAILANIVALWWNMRKTSLQNAETRRLAELTAQLDHRVHRLSANLNQKIARLNRLNDLTRGAYLSNTKLYRIFGINSLGIGRDEMSEADYFHELNADQLATYIVTTEGSFVEMYALERVIGDSDLEVRIGNMKEALLDVKFNEPPDERRKSLENFEHSVTAVHKRIYELLQEATATV